MLTAMWRREESPDGKYMSLVSSKIDTWIQFDYDDVDQQAVDTVIARVWA
jgi:hypothetical protein